MFPFWLLLLSLFPPPFPLFPPPVSVPVPAPPPPTDGEADAGALATGGTWFPMSTAVTCPFDLGASRCKHP